MVKKQSSGDEPAKKSKSKQAVEPEQLQQQPTVDVSRQGQSPTNFGQGDGGSGILNRQSSNLMSGRPSSLMSNQPSGLLSGRPSSVMSSQPSSILQRSASEGAESEAEMGEAYPQLQMRGRNFAQFAVPTDGPPRIQRKPMLGLARDKNEQPTGQTALPVVRGLARPLPAAQPTAQPTAQPIAQPTAQPIALQRFKPALRIPAVQREAMDGEQSQDSPASQPPISETLPAAKIGLPSAPKVALDNSVQRAVPKFLKRLLPSTETLEAVKDVGSGITDIGGNLSANMRSNAGIGSGVWASNQTAVNTWEGENTEKSFGNDSPDAKHFDKGQFADNKRLGGFDMAGGVFDGLGAGMDVYGGVKTLSDSDADGVDKAKAGVDIGAGLLKGGSAGARMAGAGMDLRGLGDNAGTSTFNGLGGKFETARSGDAKFVGDVLGAGAGVLGTASKSIGAGKQAKGAYDSWKDGRLAERGNGSKARSALRGFGNVADIVNSAATGAKGIATVVGQSQNAGLLDATTQAGQAANVLGYVAGGAGIVTSLGQVASGGYKMYKADKRRAAITERGKLNSGKERAELLPEDNAKMVNSIDLKKIDLYKVNQQIMAKEDEIKSLKGKIDAENNKQPPDNPDLNVIDASNKAMDLINKEISSKRDDLQDGENKLKRLESELDTAIKSDNLAKKLDPEREAFRHLVEIQNKKEDRGGIDAVLGGVSLAGGIMSLSGVGAIPGAALGAGAGGVKLGMAAARKIKQAGRDRAAKKAIKQGEDSLSSFDKMFATEKSTAKKEEKYNATAKAILGMDGGSQSSTSLPLTKNKNADKNTDKYVALDAVGLSEYRLEKKRKAMEEKYTKKYDKAEEKSKNLGGPTNTEKESITNKREKYQKRMDKYDPKQNLEQKILVEALKKR